MTIMHHPDPSTLMSYAGGGLPEALSAVVATHAAMCPACTAEIRQLESIGSALFQDLVPAPLAHGEISAGARRPVALAPGAGWKPSSRVADLPAPLISYVGERIDDIRWRRLALGIWHVRLPSTRGDLRLLRAAPGRVLPEHGHGGGELTLVLQGAYSDERGEYRRGDVSDLDQDIEHRPVADAKEGCICLIGTESKARFKRLIDKLVQPLTGM